MDNRQEAKDAKKFFFEEPSDLLDALARQVIGAAIEVHRHLGPGFTENVYEEALAVEFRLRDIPFERQPLVEVRYKQQCVGYGRPDFIVGKGLVVEVKAVTVLASVHQAQVFSYLKALGGGLGLLLNFKEGTMRAGIRRVVWTDRRHSYQQEETRKMDEAHEARERFVVARSNPSIALEVVKEDLHTIA